MLDFFALAGGVIQPPVVSALCYGWAVLEGSDRVMSSKGCEGFLVEDLAGYGLVN